MTIRAIPREFVSDVFPRTAKIRRHGEGVTVERYSSDGGRGAFGYEPLLFPKDELRTAIGYAEMWAGVLAKFDADPRPRMLTVPAYGDDAARQLGSFRRVEEKQ